MSKFPYPTIANESVVCVLLCDDGANLFFSDTNPTNFSNVSANATKAPKEDLYDKVSSLNTWAEIASRIVFLNDAELIDLLAD